MTRRVTYPDRMPSSRPIILVGCPRSGTTLLSVILHAHPRIAMPPETRFLWPTYVARNEFGDLRIAANRRALARRMTGRGTRFRHLGLDRRKVIRKIVAGPPTVGSAMAIVWGEFARTRGKERWGEKRPLYWQQMDWIMRLFPDAQVIHLIRDPRACVASMLNVYWWNSGWSGAATTWALADRELARFGKRAAPGTYYALRYEDLLVDPRTELTKLCDYLGEEFDEVMLQFTTAAGDIVPERKTWHSLTHQPLDQTRLEGWRAALAPRHIALLESVLRREMSTHGYQPSGIGGRPKPADLAAYEAQLVRRWLSISGARLRDRFSRHREEQSVAAL